MKYYYFLNTYKNQFQLVNNLIGLGFKATVDTVGNGLITNASHEAITRAACVNCVVYNV
jgi:hypothetical protein